MNEERNNTDPESILRLKDELLEHFRQLPAEHQATITLLLLKAVKESEWGEWLRGAIEMNWPMKAELGDRLFPITGISREDLQRVNFSDEDIARLTDENMRYIAQAMADHYVNDVFWDELKFHAQEVLDDKGGKP